MSTLVTATSACDAAMKAALSELLKGFGSFCGALTVAVLLTKLPPASALTCTVSVSVTVVPLVIPGHVHVTTPPASPHTTPDPPTPFTYVVNMGTGSVSVTGVASAGPLFVTVML